MSEEKKYYEGNFEDPLDALKKIDKKEKMEKLKKLMKKLKSLQKEINISKYECEKLIEQAGFDEKNAKRIIDWIGELPDVKLDIFDKKKVRERIEKKEEKTEALNHDVNYTSLNRFSTTIDSNLYLTDDNDNHYWSTLCDTNSDKKLTL
jgi:hypothetical protein